MTFECFLIISKSSGGPLWHGLHVKASVHAEPQTASDVLVGTMRSSQPLSVYQCMHELLITTLDKEKHLINDVKVNQN